MSSHNRSDKPLVAQNPYWSRRSVFAPKSSYAHMLEGGHLAGFMELCRHPRHLVVGAHVRPQAGGTVYLRGLSLSCEEAKQLGTLLVDVATTLDEHPDEWRGEARPGDSLKA